MGTQRRWRKGLPRKRGQIITSILLALVVAVPLTLAAVHPGFPATHVEMLGRDVWVTNGADERAGRLNAQISEIDASVSLDSKKLDVVQDGDNVFIHDKGSGTLGRVDPKYTDLREQIAVPSESIVKFHGTTLAILDAASGKLWTLDTEQPLSFDAAGANPALTLGAGAQVVVTDGGEVLAVSPQSGELYRIPKLGAEPVKSKIGDGGLTDYELTAVGNQAAVFDRSGNRVLLEGEKIVSLDTLGVHIQDAGPDADHVVVASASDFIYVPLSGAAPTHVGWDGANGTATDALSVARPVVVSGCAHGAWASMDQTVTACPNMPVQVQPLPARDQAGELVFRVNRNVVVLNDLATGNVWMPQDQLRFVENWEDTVPPEDSEGEDGDQEATEQTFEDTLAERTDENHPPELLDDNFGVRAGGSAYLPVLDNDTDPDGDLISITELAGQIPASVGTLNIVDHGRALQFVAAPEASGEYTVTYKGTDGRPNGLAQARVNIRVISNPAENTAPTQKHVSTVTVEASQEIRYNVMPDWQDLEGDPMYLVSATQPGGSSVTTSPDGTLSFHALGAELGDRLVSYVMSDGMNETTGELKVQVAAPGTLSPVATPDYAEGFAGATVSARPLENDLAPAGAALQIIEIIELGTGGGRGGSSYNADQQTVSYETDQPGDYYVQYTVKSGAKDTKGLIRFHIADPKTSDKAIIPVRDTLYLRPGDQSSVSPLLNDQATTDKVLSVQSVETTDEARIAGLSVELLDNTRVRVSTQNALLGPIELPYTVTDGAETADGVIVVMPVEPAVENHPPVGVDDLRTVRAGDYATVDVLKNDVHPDGASMSLDANLTDLQLGGGFAFVASDKVRFQAPDKPGTYSLAYIIRDENGEQGGARVTFTVTGLDEATNRPPEPDSQTARVFEGATIRVNVPLTGVDPDGDSVTFNGIVGHPNLGSVRSQDETSFLYEAFPGAQGTDELKYEVVDAYGVRGTGTIKVGVVPRPEETQPPVAVDDLLEARPNTIVSVPVLRNDSDPNGYRVQIVDDLSKIDPVYEPAIDGDAILIRVPEDEQFFSIPYSITNGNGGVDDAYIHVTVTPEARDRVPTAIDHVVAREDFDGVDHVDVPLRDGAWNPSGKTADLKVAAAGVYASSAEITPEGKLRLRPSDKRQVIAYTVTDEQTKLSASAFVLVPALITTSESKRQSPYLRTDLKPQTTRVDTPIEWNVNDLVVAPSGLPVHVIEPDSAWAEQGNGSSIVLSDQKLRFTPKPGFRGPASITFLVSDGQNAEDEKLAGIATIRVPITVGDPDMYDVAPTFVTPQLSVPIGESKSVDLKTATGHPNAKVIDQVQFSGLHGGSDTVTASLDGTTVTVNASRHAKVGDILKLEVTYTFREFKQTGIVNVTVTSSPKPPPRVVDDSAKGLRGSPVTLDVVANDFNPYPDVPLKIVDAKEVGATATGAKISVTGNQLVVNPSASHIGPVTVQYTVQDDTADKTRQATGHATVYFRDKPDAPPEVTATTAADSGAVTVNWEAPKSNGEDIDKYEVSLNPGGGAAPIVVVIGPASTYTFDRKALRLGSAYTASVRAHNAIDWGDPKKASESVTPTKAPGQPDGVSVSSNYTKPGVHEGSLLVSWNIPDENNEELTGGGISSYTVTLESPRDERQKFEVSKPRKQEVNGVQKYTYTVDGLRIANDSKTYSFSVTAHNKSGSSKTSVTADGVLTFQPKPELTFLTGSRQYSQDPKKEMYHFAFKGNGFKNEQIYYVICREKVAWPGTGSPIDLEGNGPEIKVAGTWLNGRAEFSECYSDRPNYSITVYDDTGQEVAYADHGKW